MSEPHRRHRTLGAGVILAVMPRADETAEEHELAGVLADRGGRVERLDQPIPGPVTSISLVTNCLPNRRIDGGPPGPAWQHGERTSIPGTWEESAELLAEPVAAPHRP